MTDQQIIIDGVDVSECCWCDSEPDTEPYCRINDGEDLNCEENPNCYFKQLKGKEQECEEINLKNERLVAEKYTMNEEFLKLKQALDEIEKYLDTQQKYFDVEDYHNLLDIINKVKEEINEES